MPFPCSACEKDMLDRDGESMAAIVVGPFIAKDPTCAMPQMGDYWHDGDYAVCYECYLKALKVKKP